jgi:hypothetical protein
LLIKINIKGLIMEKRVLISITDVPTACLLGIFFCFVIFQASLAVPAMTLKSRYFDTWFEGDMPRVHQNMLYRDSDHTETKVHPIFSLMAYSMTFAVKKSLNTDPITAVRLVDAGLAFVWIAGLFFLLRLAGCSPFDAVIFTILGAVSAASVFWLTVAERYSFASVSILSAFLAMATAEYRRVPGAVYALMNVLTFGITVTNGMAAILATIAQYKQSLKHAVLIIALSVGITGLLWGVQTKAFPTAKIMVGDKLDSWNFNWNNDRSGGPAAVLASGFYHALIMPSIKLYRKGGDPKETIMVTQGARPGSASGWGACAVILWTILLGIGIWALTTLNEQRNLRAVLGLWLLFQAALYTAYGAETFLYALNFIVALIPIAALGALTPWRKVVVTLALLLIPCVFINNSLQFQKAVDFYQHDWTKPPRTEMNML